MERYHLQGTRLTPVRVATYGPLLFVHLGADDPSLTEHLGALPAYVAPYRIVDLRFGRRIVYDIACNWKVYVENFLEGYHLPSAHPGLHRDRLPTSMPPPRIGVGSTRT